MRRNHVHAALTVESLSLESCDRPRCDKHILGLVHQKTPLGSLGWCAYSRWRHGGHCSIVYHYLIADPPSYTCHSRAVPRAWIATRMQTESCCSWPSPSSSRGVTASSSRHGTSETPLQTPNRAPGCLTLGARSYMSPKRFTYFAIFGYIHHELFKSVFLMPNTASQFSV